MYRDHKEIPAKYRRVILDEVIEKRVSKVPLAICNEIIEEHLREEEELESLKNFEVIVSKNGARRIENFKDIESAFVAMDREIGYDVQDKGIVAVLKQADRIIKAYVKGQYINGSYSIYDRF